MALGSPIISYPVKIFGGIRIKNACRSLPRFKVIADITAVAVEMSDRSVHEIHIFIKYNERVSYPKIGNVNAFGKINIGT